VGKGPLIRCRVPLRVSLAGGGTDVSPFVEDHGGVALSLALDRFVTCTVETTDDDSVELKSADYGISTRFAPGTIPLFDGNLDLIKGVLRRVQPSWHVGLKMWLTSDAPPGSGLGASSALVVSAILGLCRCLDVAITPASTAALAYIVERVDLGITGGYQDQYAAAFGGVSWMEFSGSGVRVSRPPVSDAVLDELNEHVLLWYTGEVHLSAGILEEQVANYVQRRPGSEGLFEIKRLAYRMLASLEVGDIRSVGRLLHNSWQVKRSLASSITSPAIDALYDAGLHAGALGGKLLGAGGGGYLLFIVPPEQKRDVMSALRHLGGTDAGRVRLGADTPKTWTAEFGRGAEVFDVSPRGRA